MKLKTILQGVALVSLSALFTACGSTTGSSADKGSVKLGIIQYAEHEALTSAREGFLEELAAAGYKEGENLQVDLQNSQGDQANLQTMVEKLAGKNDVNLAIATPAAQALLNADGQTPGLFTAVTDPVAAGLVDSLEKPNGTMTGSIDATDVAGQIEMLLKVVPTAKTVGIFYNSSEVNSEVQAKQAKQLLEEKGKTVEVMVVTSTNDVQQAMTSLAKKVDAIYLPTDNTVASTAATIGDVLKAEKVPAMGSDAAVIDAALFTYGVDYHAIGQEAGKLAVKILKGEKPADLAVAKPRVADIAVNEEMANILGMDVETIKALGKE